MPFDKKIPIRIRFSADHTFLMSCRWIVVVISLPYLIWEIFWAKKVGYAFIKWHTHLALYIYIWLASYLFLHILNSFFHWKRYIQYQITVASIFAGLLIFEVFLTVTGIEDTYSEKIKFGYSSRYDSRFESLYRVHNPNEHFLITRPEFKYLRQCNSLGYSDIEWQIPKKNSHKRILCLGDSFTEGVGAPYDSSYVSILRSLLHHRDTNYEVMNAGISGDDPCVNFVAYRDILKAFKPDIIIQTLSSNDMNTDISIKGGLERYTEQRKIKFRPAPWWEPIYALSYVSRVFFRAVGYNELLLMTPFSSKEIESLDSKAIQLFSLYSKEVKKNNALLIVVLQPNQSEIYLKKFEYDLSNISTYLNKSDGVKVYDLSAYYSTYFANNENVVKTYYWKQDGHHNSRGYHLMAKGVLAAIDSFDKSAIHPEQ